MVNYSWTCLACHATVEVGNNHCGSCGCPAESTVRQQEAHRAAHLAGTPLQPPTLRIPFINNVFEKSTSNIDSLGIKITKTKSTICLNMRAENQMNLVIEKPSSYSRFLQKLSLFQSEKTGDSEFDALFQMTAYRDDVINILKTNAGLRRSIIQLANDVPSFSSLIFSNEKISLILKIGKLSKGDAQGSACIKFASMLDKLVLPFRRLPIDKNKQALARKIDIYAPYLPFLSLLSLTALSVAHANKPFAAGGIPWKLVFEGAVLLIVLHFTILVFLTKSGAVRAQGLLIAAVVFVFGSLSFVPKVVEEVNGISEQDVMTETVEFADLYMYKPAKGAPRYYIQLAKAPERLAAGELKSGPCLEVSHNLYQELENAKPKQNSLIRISEARGLLGLPFVVSALPV
jgi:hypothetical protein